MFQSLCLLRYICDGRSGIRDFRTITGRLSLLCTPMYVAALEWTEGITFYHNLYYLFLSSETPLLFEKAHCLAFLFLTHSQKLLRSYELVQFLIINYNK